MCVNAHKLLEFSLNYFVVKCIVVYAFEQPSKNNKSRHYIVMHLFRAIRRSRVLDFLLVGNHYVHEMLSLYRMQTCTLAMFT